MKCVLVVALALLAAQPCLADGDDVQGYQLNWDNDLWARGRTDRWYTNGVRFSWSYDKPPTTQAMRLLREGSKWFLWDEAEPSLSYSVGQSMYTPRDIRVAEPQLEDRPWGAFLFGSATAHAMRKREFRATELKVGVTGPGALGEQAQKFVHRVTESEPPQGWHQQLKSRLGVQLSHSRVYRIGDTEAGDWFGFQYGWGATVGTLRGHANLNVAMTIGGLTGENAPLLIGNEGDFVVQDFKNRPQYRHPYGFLAANVTGVSYNYFLEGRTPYGKARLEPHRSYTMFSAGFSLPLDRYFSGRWPRVVYTQSVRTAEFRTDTLDRNEARQRWGTLTLNWDTN
jgi:lipid A 3-O-deacylase